MRIVPKGGRDGREEMEGKRWKGRDVREEMEGKGWRGRERKCIL